MRSRMSGGVGRVTGNGGPHPSYWAIERCGLRDRHGTTSSVRSFCLTGSSDCDSSDTELPTLICLEAPEIFEEHDTRCSQQKFSCPQAEPIHHVKRCSPAFQRETQLTRPSGSKPM
jgi:hypothetical protein